MLAGPNGSGKSTLLRQLVEVLSKEVLGTYINADDIERALKEKGFLELSRFGVRLSQHKVAAFFRDQGAWIVPKRGAGAPESVVIESERLSFGTIRIDSYVAAVVADLLRRELLSQRRDFAFETVMSSASKVELLRAARSQGYRTYLYFIATANAEINLERVSNRVRLGGHPVSEEAIRSRYVRSLELLLPALREATRAYVFDNSQSGVRGVLLAEKLESGEIELRQNAVPEWFDKAVLARL